MTDRLFGATSLNPAAPLRLMDVPAVLDALGDDDSGEAAVVVRLVLMAADRVTGEQEYVSSFVKRISMPATLVGPEMTVALDILGERHVFKPSAVAWDEAHRVYILEVVWVVADQLFVPQGERGIDAERPAHRQHRG
jgi:hypothetical protein